MKISRREILLAAAGLGFYRQASAAGLLFEEIPSAKSGLTWTHDNARSDKRYLPESEGPGCAFFDFDNDGWMDIYLVNSGPCEFWKPIRPIRNALYQNNRDGTFTDVTEKAGVGGGTFGMGVAIGDYDNDGWPDLFVTGYGRCILYRNNRNGTFTDVTAAAGLERTGWTTSAVWFDYDNDGHLDLFVCSFVDYSADHKLECGDNKLGRHYYCIPSLFKGTHSLLYHNNGDGTFTEVGQHTAIGKLLGKGLGVVATDINNDGRMDLFVSNDTVQNYLFLNRGPDRNGYWQFEESGMEAEVALSDSGKPRSGMGVDAADLNNDGWEDLFVANVDQEMYSVYVNEQNETFRDAAYLNGVARATRLLSGWGLKYFDYDNDGLIDLILANGHPDDMIDSYSPFVRYKEPLLLFHQEADGKLGNVSAAAGPAFQQRYAARGLAVGDFDNDGALDVLIGNNGSAPLLLRNRAAAGQNWLGLSLEGVNCNRDAVGARIIWKTGGRIFHRFKSAGGSYLSSHDPREVLGLGKSAKLDLLEIRWPAPSTHVESFTKLEVNRYYHLVEGKGVVTAARRD